MGKNLTSFCAQAGEAPSITSRIRDATPRKRILSGPPRQPQSLSLGTNARADKQASGAASRVLDRHGGIPPFSQLAILLPRGWRRSSEYSARDWRARAGILRSGCE